MCVAHSMRENERVGLGGSGRMGTRTNGIGQQKVVGGLAQDEWKSQPAATSGERLCT